MSEQPTTSKGTRFVQFLEALVRIRSKTIHDLKSYEHVFSLGRLPNEPECFSQHRDSALEDDPDLWLEVRKPKEPRVPPPPSICLPWINAWDRNDFETEPQLRETILAPVPASDLVDDREEQPDEEFSVVADNELHLKDHPNVMDAWNDYISSHWNPWAARRSRWHAVQKKYAKLFDIYSYMQTRGEQVELLLGVGLLSWRLKGATIRRHLITARVDLTFDENRARFSVRPHSADVQLHPEFDMLPPDVMPPSVETTAQEGLRSAEDDIWDRGTVDSVLESIAHQLSDQGDYFADQNVAEQHATEHPVVQFAPMLILRRRSERSVHLFLKRIREQISAEGEAPAGWLDLTESSEAESGPPPSDNPDRIVNPATEMEPYFPLFANEEQMGILGALRHPIGALVQGPPGTGKSHTIGNLICHLLATGQRILVTAQTPQALQVLKDKLPEEIQPLAVSLLGTGADEQRSLEKSVQGITGKFNDANPSQYRRMASDSANERLKIRKRAAVLLHQRRSIRERDTMVQDIAGYSGTAEQIAKAVVEKAERFSWLMDEVPHDDVREPPTDSLRCAIDTLRRLRDADGDRLTKRRPIPGIDILSPADFTAAVQSENAAKAHIDSHQAIEIDAPLSDESELLVSMRTAIEAMQRLDVVITNANARPQQWLPTAMYEVLTKQDRPWFELQMATEKTLAEIRNIVREEDRKSVSLSKDRDWNQVIADATTLRQHLLDRHKLRMWFLKPASIKQCRYLTSDVRIDGILCVNVDSLDALIQHGRLHLDLDHIWKLWVGKASPSSGSLSMQAQEIEELQEALNEVLDVYRSVERGMEAIAIIPTLAEPIWSSTESRKKTLQSLQLRVSRIELSLAVNKLNHEQDILSTFRALPTSDCQSVDQLLAAVVQRNPVGYSTACQHTSQLDQDSEDLTAAQVALSTISERMPQLARAIGENPTDPDWDTRIDLLGPAIDHARAAHWLDEFLNESSLNEIENELSRCEKKRRSCLAEEAALLAWAHSFDRLEESHRRALVAWQQAMNAVGKGTGRHAPRHRREAQKQLQKCRPAIPAWIMPLHRVFDSIDPKPGMFDVIIVDEASQCGPDALPLFYIGKKIIIVGDDKQISPSHVGVKREHVNQRMREYLNDFEEVGSFDLERSLFAHGERMIGNRIVLREHFRCMPEIIRFSNDLCYADTPLIPLRQYPPNRLEPLMARHVPEGYRDGTGSNSINKPEAEQLVEAVVMCCNDPRYKRDGVKLTFGVISLLNWNQAKHIEHLLLKTIGAEEMAQRRLLCGDAYSFQGDERDVIFLSMVAAPNTRLNALTRFAYKQRFNVAASRACDQLWLFHSVLPEDLGQECVRRKLLEHFLYPSRSAREVAGIEVEDLELIALRANRTVEDPPEPFESWFEVDVALCIARKGFRVVPQVKVGGYRIDLVVEGYQSRLAVECDGDIWHGPDRYEADLARQRKLERAGWIFVRVRSSSFHANQNDTMQPVWERLDKLGIHEPGKVSPAPETGIEQPPLDPVNKEPVENPPHSEPNTSLSGDGPPMTPSGQNQHNDAPNSQSLFPPSEENDPALKNSDVQQSELYQNWASTPMSDPREASTDAVMKRLLSIIAVEGPILASRAYHLYANAADLHRVGSALRSVFNRAVAKAKREELLELEQTDKNAPMLHAILRSAGSPKVRPRTRGSRAFNEIPSSEIAWFMRHFLSEQPDISDEDLYRSILDHYDLKRLRGPTRDRLVDIHLNILDRPNDGNSDS